MGRGAWRATVHGVAKSRTRLSNCAHMKPKGGHHWGRKNMLTAEGGHWRRDRPKLRQAPLTAGGGHWRRDHP